MREEKALEKSRLPLIFSLFTIITVRGIVVKHRFHQRKAESKKLPCEGSMGMVGGGGGGGGILVGGAVRTMVAGAGMAATAVGYSPNTNPGK